MGQNRWEDDGDTLRKRTPSLSSHESTVQRSAEKEWRWKIVDPLLCRPGNDYNYFSNNYFCKSAQSFTEQSWKCVKNMIPITREDQVWENSRVSRSCQCDQQTCFWTMMILHMKNYYCKDMQNEFKIFRQQDKLNKFCSDARFLTVVEIGTVLHDNGHWRILTIYRISGLSWVHSQPKLDPCWKPQGKFGVDIRIESVNRDNSHSWVRISHGLNKLSRTWTKKDKDNNEQETSEMHFEEYALRLNASDFASRSKAKSKTIETRFCQLIPKNDTYWGKNLDWHWTIRIFW